MELEGESSDFPSGPGYGLSCHCLVLGPRASHKNFSTWMKDCLVKQGMVPQEAEALVKSLAQQVNCLPFTVKVAKSFLTGLEIKLGRKEELLLPDLMLLDCLIARLQILLEKTFNSGKPTAGLEGPGFALD